MADMPLDMPQEGESETPKSETPTKPDHAAAATRPRTSSRVRSVLVGIGVVLTCITLLSSIMAIWVEQTLLNTDRWVQLVTPLSRDPQLANTLSVYVADQVVTALGVQQRAEQALPPRLEFLAGPLTQRVQDFTQTQVANLLQNQKLQNAWVQVNRTVHTQVVRLLRGETTNVTIVNGAVVVNLLPIIKEALTNLQARLPGLIPQAVAALPQQLSGTIQQQRAQLSQAIGQQLPPDFGQITLFQSDYVTTAQRAVAVLDALQIALPLLTLALLALTLWFSRRRRRTALELGIGIVVVFLAARLLIGFVQNQVVAAITNPAGRELVGDMLTSVVGGLEAIAVWLIVLGALLAVAMFLAGRPQWFVGLWHWLQGLWVKMRPQTGT
ncbi:MAG: hypothetical protein OJF49_001646 [Ktedonobacterales bacterium]|nr:MAG: hypothetical protein OJF49_001646 [Ktedonobacterales bacterium]